MNKSKFKNTRWLGLLSGFIGPFIGSCLYYLYYLNEAHYTGVDQPLSLVGFLQYSYHYHLLIQVLTIGSLLNIALFFLFIKLDWLRSARGVLLATVFYIIPFVLIKFVL